MSSVFPVVLATDHEDTTTNGSFSKLESAAKDSDLEFYEHEIELNKLINSVRSYRASDFDSDGDGVMDDADICRFTQSGDWVDVLGCSYEQLYWKYRGIDTDGDRVADFGDDCQMVSAVNSPGAVDGCPGSMLDQDGDGVTNDIDDCMKTGPGEPVDEFGCSEYDFVPHAMPRLTVLPPVIYTHELTILTMKAKVSEIEPRYKEIYQVELDHIEPVNALLVLTNQERSFQKEIYSTDKNLFQEIEFEHLATYAAPVMNHYQLVVTYALISASGEVFATEKDFPI